MMDAADSLAWWTLLALMSSSCCALQLLLNLFSFGCAGFNTVLGPARPFLLALTLLTQTLVWHAALTGRGPTLIRAAVGGTLVSAALTFLPEALELYMRRGGR